MVSGGEMAVSAPHDAAGNADKRNNTSFVGGVIPYQADIGKGTTVGYQGIGVVIHKKAVIGRNCSIGQNVTIGGGGRTPGVPRIGDNVHIGAGAVVIGGIHIGDNVTIGANAVVNKDIPSDCVAVGVPAKPVKFLSGS